MNANNITREDIEAAIVQLQGTGTAKELVAVIDAFDVPKISYDPVGRKMYADKQPRSFLANATVSLKNGVSECHACCMHETIAMCMITAGMARKAPRSMLFLCMVSIRPAAPHSMPVMNH